MPVIEQIRSQSVESVHPWSAVAIAHGQVVQTWGEPVATTWRSAAKPVQLDVSLTVLGDPPVPTPWLALGAASHSGEPVHTAMAQEILTYFHMDPADLRCGTHPPGHTPSADAILRAGGHFTDLHNNCSGKHSFMVAAARHAGWPLDYRPAEHPLQMRIRQRVVELCEAEPELSVDGCGVPTFCLPLVGIARAWSVIAAEMHGQDSRLGRIGRAMAAHPELTSGTDRLDLAVARRACLPMAVKIGAGGVFCMALPDAQLGVAIKIHSGTAEALPVAIDAVLRALWPAGWPQVADWPPLQVTNVVGRLVGGWQARAV
jgi:L-asparaginase II